VNSRYFHNIVDFHQWNRKIMNAYWVVFASTSLAFAIIGVVTREQSASLWESFLMFCIIPSMTIATVLGVTEITLRSGSNLRHYFMMMSGTAFSVVVMNTLPNVPGVQMVFLPPLFASLAYYDKRKVLFSFVLNMCAFLFFYFFHPELHVRIGLAELLVTIFCLFNCLLIVLSLMTRGAYLHRALLQSTQHKQELIIQNALMDKLSKMDALTDLYNHKTFHEFLSQFLDNGGSSTLSLQLALLDIDNFKQINDTYGHWAGDQVLKRIASTIRKYVSNHDFAFRYGGEEFAVLFTEKNQAESYAILEQIRIKISEIQHEELKGTAVTVSIGVHNYESEMGRERLFKGADDCLYHAKRNGKNRIVTSPGPQ
jgi:diguanylate cyclase (GGDEF)-like protein